MKTVISQTVAKRLLSQKLESINIPDSIYEWAMETVQKNVDEIKNQHVITGEEDGEAYWFDDVRDNFVKSVFEELTENSN